MNRFIRWIRPRNGTQLASEIMLLLSFFILGYVVYANLTIDVLKNWRLVLPAGDIHVGDTVVVQSLYTKTMNVTGRSVRYVECKSASGVFVRYPVSVAVANRAPGTTGTGIVITIPDTIPDIPATCRINVTIDYPTPFFRHVIESTNTHDFTLFPDASGSESGGVSQNTSQSTTPLPSSPSQSPSASSSLSSTNSTPTVMNDQQSISQGDSFTSEVTPLNGVARPQPGLIQSILSPLKVLIGIGVN